MSVFSPVRSAVREQTLLFTADGVKYNLDVPPERFILSEEGLGMPPIDYVSQRGPYQHGETLRDFFLKPRAFQTVIRHNYCGRAAYWAGRKQLLDILRPGRGGTPGQLTFRRIMPGRIIRDIVCTINTGPVFAPRDVKEWDEVSYTETLKFTAYNPIWFDPVQKTVVYVPTIVGTFPMTFPVIFEDFTVGPIDIGYGGDWIEYPSIRIDGPIGDFVITNNTTGQFIETTFPIVAGQFITIDLTYGMKTVVLNDGTNLIGYVLASSDLAQFHLEPGVNEIFITGTGVDTTTAITISYFNRYLGI